MNQPSTNNADSFLQLTKIRSTLSAASNKFEAAVQAVAHSKSSIDDLRVQYEAALAAKDIVQEVSISCQEACQKRIGYVVTRCLQAVFPDQGLTFRLVFEQKRGQTEVRGVLVDAEGHELDPLQSCGGGILDVAAFGLRLACLMLQRPQPARVLILDEPFRFVSSHYRSNVRALLSELSHEMGVQIIMVTHIEEFMDFDSRLEIA
jgi:DNA repair exonuclease SbcCD ATPase subunit